MMHIYHACRHTGMHTCKKGIHACRQACHKFIYLFIMMDAMDFDDDEVGARAELAMVVAETTDHVATLGEIDRLSDYIVSAAHSDSTKTNYEGALI